MIMNEIFGEENFIDNIIWKKRYGGGAKEKYLVSVHEYIVFFAKNKEKLDPLFVPTSDESIERYYTLKDEKYAKRGGYRTHPLEATKSMGERKNLVYSIPAPDGTEVLPKRQWLWSRERTMNALRDKGLEFIKTKEGWTVHTKQYLKDENGEVRESKLFSIIDDVYTQHGTNEIINIFGNAQVFSFPKPVKLIQSLIQIGTSSNTDIVLDLFAGSGTTAHAVMAQNQGDSGKRKFILVQMPEPTDPNSETYKAGYKTIAEIGKERIRRMIKGYGDEPKPINDGFKVFKLDKSNYAENLFEYEPEKTDEENDKAFKRYLADAENLFRYDKVNELDFVYENIVKEGLSLNAKIAEITVGKNKIYKAADGEREIFVSLDKEIHSATVAALKGKEYKDKLFVCFDTALDDSQKANLALNVSLKTI
jgi:adenine-specific DNA-methyltransferase